MIHPNRNRYLTALAALLAIALAGCQARSESASTEAAAKPAAAPKSATAPNEDSVEVEPAMAANVKVEPVREEALPRVLTATGKIQFNEDQAARVLAPMPGQVLDLKPRVGDVVEKDSILFHLKSREIAGLVTDLMQAQREQALADKSYVMTKDLFEHQAASRVALQQAEGDLAKARTQTVRAEEALRVFGLEPAEVLATNGVRTLIPVRAPISGTVIERPVTPGQFVQGDNTPLLTIVDMSTVWVLMDVFETDVHLIRLGERVEVTAAAYPDRHFSAAVDRINDKVDPETRTLKVRLLVSNPGLLLKPEMFITASVVVREKTTALTVPAKALFTEGDRSYAFVAVDDRHFERRLVVASADGAARRRVTTGIRPGDRVVADGALLLRLRQKQQQQPE